MISNYQNEIGFLLGAGISTACNPLLTTDVLTHKILSGSETTNMDERYVSSSLEFLKRIKVEIDQYYSNITNRLSNYEDLYYVTSQIEDSETFNFDNPVVKSFIEKISKDIKPLLESLNFNKIEQLTKVVRRYIRNNIWFILRDSHYDTTKLQFILDFIDDKKISKIIIFSLNHDLLIENILEQHNIDYENGFGNRKGKLGHFYPSRYLYSKQRIRFVKLHGSINWQRYSHEKIELFESSKYNSTYEDNPVFLIGTFNKMFDYTNNDIFLQLYHIFYTLLNRIKTLIISGYSFSDKGINTRLYIWMGSNPENKIIIIHPNCDGLKNSARGIISINCDDWEEKKKLIPISKGIERTTWEKVKEKILTKQQ